MRNLTRQARFDQVFRKRKQRRPKATLSCVVQL
jgi:hypothetical protein